MGGTRSAIAALALALVPVAAVVAQPAPASPAAVDPEVGALVDRYIALSGLERLAAQAGRAVDPAAIMGGLGPELARLERERPGFTTRLAAFLQQESQAMVQRMVPATLGATRAFLLERFTADELAEMVRYLESPVGRKAVELTPELVQLQQAATEERFRQEFPELQARVQEFLRSELAAAPPRRS